MLKRMYSTEQRVKLFQIAGRMSYEGLSRKLAVEIVTTALEYEGVADLMELWSEETDAAEKEEIIADIQGLIDDCNK